MFSEGMQLLRRISLERSPRYHCFLLQRQAALRRISLERSPPVPLLSVAKASSSQENFPWAFSTNTFAFCEVFRNECHVTTKASSSQEFFPWVFSAIVSGFDCGYLMLTECLMCECIVSHVHNDQLPSHTQSCIFGCRPSVFVLCCPSIKILETASIGVDLQLSVTKNNLVAMWNMQPHSPGSPQF